MERNPGQEEAILQDLLQFAHEQGVLLPYALPGKTQKEMQSTAPINTIVSNDNHATSQLWETIRYKLCRGLWIAMGKLLLTTDSNSCLISHQQRLDLVQNLCFLFPASEIWESYKQYRLQQIQRYITNAELLHTVKLDLPTNTPKDVVALAKLGKAMEVMILEDVAMLEEEIFPKKLLALEFIQDSYLKKFTEELKCVLENHAMEENGSSVKTSSSSACAQHDILQVHKQCYLSSVSLELLVQMVVEQQDMNKTGTVMLAFLSLNYTYQGSILTVFHWPLSVASPGGQ